MADRLNGVGEYYFSKKLREIEEMNRQGQQVINLGIGSPDLPPHPDVIEVLRQETLKAGVHSYQPYRGAEPLRVAFANWYREWYQVELDPAGEILPLIGSKEGIMHICMTYLNEGDIALVPNPGYPTYKSAVVLAGGTCLDYTLEEKNSYYPDFTQLEKVDLRKVKLMFVNYPHMPSGQPADANGIQRIVDFASLHNILIVHDNPYSFILNKNPFSILSLKGAKDVSVELNSLSKSHNMAGWRVGVMCGSRERIDEVLRFKSNMDSGMFLPVQLAAAKALSLGKEWFYNLHEIYTKRKQKAQELVGNVLQCRFATQQEGLFLWAQVPARYQNGFEMSDEILYKSNVFLTPGGIFGSAGDRYIRVSLCCPVEKFETAIERITHVKAST